MQSLGETTRIGWIDTAKGIGILCVVAGHTVSAGHTYIFWFHMPLFFFLSGYLYNPGASLFSFAQRKFRRLLVPYFSFLILLSIPDYALCVKTAHNGPAPGIINQLVSLTLTKLYGGRDLYGWFDIFWFVTCLFLTQQIFHICHTLCKGNAVTLAGIMLFFYGYTVADYFTGVEQLPLFWGLNVVPMAVVFFFMGYIQRRITYRSFHFYLSLGTLAAAIFMQQKGIITHAFNMKWAAYGIPVVNVIVAYGCILVLMKTAQIIAHSTAASFLFSELGKASIIILFMHQAVHLSLTSRFGAIQGFVLITTIVAALYFMYCVCASSKVLSHLFIGGKQRFSIPIFLQGKIKLSYFSKR